MFRISKLDIHPNLQNYLKAIWMIQQKGEVVRVKDLARDLGLKNGTVVSGLKSLAQKGLVVHAHYGHVELTQKGNLAALQVVHRHEVLHDFLSEILQIQPDLAEEDACALEHYISDEGLHRMIHLVEYLHGQSDLEKIHEYLKDKVSPSAIPLGGLKAGELGIVSDSGGDKALKRRLLDLGVVAGAELFVASIAPLGDPMEIVLNGVHLTLRRKEAEAVRVVKKEIQPLSDAQPGLSHVVYLKGDKEFLKEIEKLNLMPGQIVEVLNGGGAVQIRRNGVRTVLSTDLARRIYVQPFHDRG